MTQSATPSVTPGDQVLVVRLGEGLHAIPVAAVEEILPTLPVEPVAQCPSFVRGVVYVRGHLIPVLDLAERLGMADHVRPAEPHIVCLRWSGRLVGVQVDEALDLMKLPDTAGLSAELLGAGSGLIQSVIERDGQIVRLLNPARLVAPDEAPGLSEMPTVA